MRTVIKFDKNVPIPPVKRGRRPGGSRFESMGVGDSFVGTKIDASVAWSYAKSRGWTVERRKMPDGTYRVWRTE